MTHRYRYIVWIAGFIILTVGVLLGTMLGAAAGYTLLNTQLTVQAKDDSPVYFNGSESTLVGQPPTLDSPSWGASQFSPTFQELGTVEAIDKALPAVVKIINQGSRGIGSGSGFFISSEGYVVTNNHVVNGARELTIIYAQGGSAPARLVGTAPDFDLAVLKVDGPVPAVVEWGDSGELPLGSELIAIGTALGQYQNTVTSGILSGFNRKLGGISNLLQTDAAINQGNSGGPLINLGGQVIGINTMVLRGNFSGSAEGLGFAIPSNTARTVVERLIETGEVRAPFLGIEYQELNPQLATEIGLNIIDGALIQDVVSGSPAAQAGLKTGDVIIGINGRQLDDRHPLISVLLEYVAGDKVTLDVLRNGKTFQVSLTLAERA